MGAAAGMSNPSLEWAAAGERARRSLSTRVWIALGLLPVVVVGTGVFAMVKLAAWAASCPASAEPRGGEAEASRASIGSLVPRSVPGHTLVRGAAFDATEFPNDLYLSRAGFKYGFRNDFIAGDKRVQISVLQFESNRAARDYETEEIDDACYSDDAGELSLARSFGASGIDTTSEDGTPQHRIAILRGSRAYVATITGNEIHSDADVLATMAGAAR